MTVQAKTQVHEDVFTQSFALQYISLILFILIFSIAAFMPKDEVKMAEASTKQVPISEDIDRTVPLTLVLTKDLINHGTMKPEAMQPYITLINNHDLNLRITFFWNENTSRYGALSRARQLREYLLSKEIPAESFIVETRYGMGTEAAIEVNKGADAWKTASR